MAKTVKGVGPQGKALFLDNPSNKARRVQTFSSDSDLNEEKLLELSNDEVAEKSTSLSVTASIEFNNYGTISTFMQAVGQGQWQGENNPARILTDTDFNDAVIDTICHMSNDDATLDFAEYCGNMYLTSFSFNYPADGVATETYDYSGNHNRLYANDWKNVSVYKADFVIGDTSKALISGANLAATHNPILLLKNHEVIAELSDTDDGITFTNSGADTEVTATNEDGAITFASGDRIRVLVSGSGSTYSTLSSTPAGIGGLRRGHVRAFLWNPSSGNMEQTLRIQSLSIDGDLSRDDLIELGSKEPYHKKLGRPINVSISMEVNETDLEEYAKLLGSETSWDANTLREIDFNDFLRTSNLEILEYKDEVEHTFANELRRLKMTNVSVASDSDSTSAGDVVGTRTINLSAENFVVSGSGVNPYL